MTMRALLIILALCHSFAWATLEFEATTVEVDAAVDAERVTVDFKFTNKTDKRVTIAKFKTNCDCLAVQVSGGMQLPNKTKRYEPGETGVVRGIFKIGNQKGILEEEIVLWLRGDPEDKPSIRLTPVIKIPELITLKPKTIKWPVGAKANKQCIEVIMAGPEPIHVTETHSSSPQFTIELETVKEGAHYKAWVTPTETEKPGIAVIRIVTDAKVEVQKIQQGFAMVHRPE